MQKNFKYNYNINFILFIKRHSLKKNKKRLIINNIFKIWIALTSD